MKLSYLLKLFFICFLCFNNTYSQKKAKLIDKGKLVQIMSADNYQLLDVRTEEEFQQGYIEGAVNIDYWDPDFEQKVKATLDKTMITIVYCAAGGRSEMACKLLSNKGFKLLYDLQGGYEDYN
jgi:rhodanese-related sulfurtransferase